MSDKFKEDERLVLSPADEDLSAPSDAGSETGAAKSDGKTEHENLPPKKRAPSPALRDQFLGTVVNDRYRILSLVGKGATSAVYKADDEQTNEIVALKILHTHLASEPWIVQRFEQEAKHARILQHPNVVAVRAYETAESGNPFIVMEFVEGSSLQDAIKAAGWLPIPRALQVFLQVCAALATAHEKGVVHRDLKPSNIMLSTTSDGALLVKVLDFGIAKVLPTEGDTVLKLTQTGETLGSLLYMSPEQCLDQDLDARSDCYSLGCVMYESLTGKPPICARTAFETMNKQISELPQPLEKVRPDIAWPNGLQDVVLKALAKSPAQRYQKITDLQDDLKTLSAGKPLLKISSAPVSSSNVVTAGDETSSESLKRYRESTQKERKSVYVGGWICLVLCALLVACEVLGGLSLGPVALILFFVGIGCILLGRYDKTRYEYILNAIEMVEKTQPVKISVSRIDRKRFDSGQYSTNGLFIDILGTESAPITKMEIEAVNPTAPMWNSMCAASQLNLIVPGSTFPIAADLYVDSKQQPVAVTIGGSLAWIRKW